MFAGCKIKALRAKTNTYIKTPVRGEEPVFVVTGRKEDVNLAKREILSAADHFSQIRASRTKNNINSTLAFGQLVANQPGQTTCQVRVPYRVVGLVVGPKGATIKRIQQQTHTYIVTPSRDKEPVFEVTGLPENVDQARREIEGHIALRTGTNGDGSSTIGSSLYGLTDDTNFGTFDPSANGASNSSKFTSGGMHNGLDSAFNSLNSSASNGKPLTIQSILDSNNFDLSGHSGANGHGSHQQFTRSHSMTNWSNGGPAESHDSGLNRSPTFESNGHSLLEASLSDGHSNGFRSNGTGIWGNLDKMMGNLEINGGSNGTNGSNGTSSSGFMNGANGGSHFQAIGSRASLDLGTLSRPNGMSNGLTNGASNGLSHGASNGGLFTNGGSQATVGPIGNGSSSSGENSPPNSLPSFMSQHRASVSSEPSQGPALNLFHKDEEDAANGENESQAQLVDQIVNNVVTADNGSTASN